MKRIFEVKLRFLVRALIPHESLALGSIIGLVATACWTCCCLEHIPGGAKWRYVWGSCLAFVFGIQLSSTGLLVLMTAYSPGDCTTAWGSVVFHSV